MAIALSTVYNPNGRVYNMDMNNIQREWKEEVLKEYKLVIKKVSVNGDKPVIMQEIRTMEDKYVGVLDDAQIKSLFTQGILPETDYRDNNVVSIGKSYKDDKWYGWSHRAMCGFSIGDVVKEGDCTASSGWTEEYLADHPEKNLALPVGFEAKTEEDVKRMAIAFADSVS